MNVFNASTSEFKVEHLKENGFDPENFKKADLYNMFDVISNPHHIDTAQPIKAPTPEPLAVSGVQTDHFIEKPITYKDPGYYYPLDNPYMYGHSLKDTLGKYDSVIAGVLHPNVRDSFIVSDPFLNEPLVNYFGAHPYDPPFKNLIFDLDVYPLWISNNKEPLEGNIENDPHGISLKGQSSFKYNIHIETEGDYCSSVYARQSYQGYITEQFSGIYMEKGGIKISPQRVVSLYDSKINNGNITVEDYWNPIISFFHLTPGDYTLCMTWNPESPNLNLRLCGLTFTPGNKFRSFDFRSIPLVNQAKIVPLIFNLDSLNPMNSNWIISYKKQVIESKLSFYDSVDGLGSISWGISNGNFFLGSSTKHVPQEYNRSPWEIITLSYDVVNKLLKIYYSNDGNTIEGPELLGVTPDKFNSVLSDRVHYNLSLGFFNNKITPGSYKDLIYLPVENSNDLKKYVDELSLGLFAVAHGTGANLNDDSDMSLRALNISEGYLN